MSEKKYAIYARVSTLEETQESSMKAQQEDLVKRCEALYPGEDLYKVYADHGISGAKENRPGFQAMIQAAEAGEFSRVVTKSISRFARNTRVLLSYLERLEKAGVSVYFLEENIDTGSGSSRFLLTVLGGVAEMERENTVSHIKEAYELKHAAGKPARPFVRPYGYIREKGVTTPDPETSEVVKRIFKLFVEENMAASSIARKLNNEGVSVPRPVTDKRRYWNRKTVLDVLARKAYMGTLVEGEHEFPGTIPAIITPALWEQARVIREKRRKPTAAERNFAPSLYPLSGVAYCKCGQKLTRFTRATTSTKPLPYTDPCNGVPIWGCLTRSTVMYGPSCGTYMLGESILYAMIIEAIAYVYAQSSEILPNNAFLSAAKAEEYDRLLSAYEERLKELESSKARELELYREGLVSLEALKPRIRSLETEIAKLHKPEPPEAIQANLEALESFFRIHTDIFLNKEKKFTLLRTELERLFSSDEARRSITRGLISRVVIGEEPRWQATITVVGFGEVTVLSDRRNPERRGKHNNTIMPTLTIIEEHRNLTVNINSL